MYSRNYLHGLKRSKEKEIYYEGGLRPLTGLKHGHYEIIHLEKMGKDYLEYKGLDLNTGDFITIKEFYPRQGLGDHAQSSLKRHPVTGVLEVHGLATGCPKAFESLLDAFVHDAKCKERMTYHRSLTRILDDFRDLGTAFVVSTYNPWPTLEMVFEDQEILEQDLVHDWIQGLIKDLSASHRRGIIHPRINPRNLFVTPTGLYLEEYESCRRPRDIKIFDGDAYENQYYAPEVKVSQGQIGPWSDVYAIGKIMIDLISKTVSDGNYMTALDTLATPSLASNYGRVIQEALSYESDDRIKDGQDMLALLYPRLREKRTFRPSQSLVVTILLLALISSSLVVWRSLARTQDDPGDYMVLNEEEAPLSSVKAITLLTSNKVSFDRNSGQIEWLRLNGCQMSTYTIRSDYGFVLEGKLRPDQEYLDIGSLGLSQGTYELVLTYQDQGKEQKQVMTFTLGP